MQNKDRWKNGNNRSDTVWSDGKLQTISFTREGRKWNLNLSDLCNEAGVFYVTHNSFLFCYCAPASRWKIWDNHWQRQSQLRWKGKQTWKKNARTKKGGHIQRNSDNSSDWWVVKIKTFFSRRSAFISHPCCELFLSEQLHIHQEPKSVCACTCEWGFELNITNLFPCFSTP